MLAGLFLTYRAANHQGLDLRTTDDRNAFRDERLIAFKELSGEDIESTRDYLQKIGFSPPFWMVLGIGRSLFHFVMAG